MLKQTTHGLEDNPGLEQMIDIEYRSTFRSNDMKRLQHDSWKTPGELLDDSRTVPGGLLEVS